MRQGVTLTYAHLKDLRLHARRKSPATRGSSSAKCKRISRRLLRNAPVSFCDVCKRELWEKSDCRVGHPQSLDLLRCVTARPGESWLVSSSCTGTSESAFEHPLRSTFSCLLSADSMWPHLKHSKVRVSKAWFAMLIMLIWHFGHGGLSIRGTRPPRI
jgi:hypothetical protein